LWRAARTASNDGRGPAGFPAAELKLGDGHIRIIERFGVLRTFKDGEVLVEAGACAPNFYVVRSGEVHAVEFSHGTPQVVWQAGPGESLGEVAFLSGQASTLSRIARGDAEVWEIHPENLRRIIDEEAGLGSVILTTLIARMQIMLDLQLTPLRVIGSRFSADTFRIRDFLTRNRVFFSWIDIETDTAVDELVKNLNIDQSETPVVTCGAEWMLRNPGNKELGARIGILSRPKETLHDLVIVSAGPAGLTAAVYGASEGLHTLVLERAGPGGQAGTSSRIENYPGFPKGLSGEDLAGRITLQARKFGAQILAPCEVVKLELDNGYPILYMDDGARISTRCVLIATGASYRRLAIAGGDRFDGIGVYYAATPMEAQACEGAEVAVVGGANSAGQAAVFLAGHARRVFLLIRGDNLDKGMSRYLSRRIEQTANIEVLFHTEITGLTGERHLEEILLANKKTSVTRKPCDARHLRIHRRATPYRMAKGVP
jgi:thioredoxin reductase (NADPH)